jgi:hypothetical protein
MSGGEILFERFTPQADQKVTPKVQATFETFDNSKDDLTEV